MDIFSFLVIISGAANLFLGYLVLTRGAKNRATFTLSSCAILSGIWATLLYLYHFHIIFSSFFWIKAVYFIVFIVVFNLFYFSLIFPFQRWKSIFFPIFLYWIISIPLFYTLFFTKLWIKDVIYKWWGPETILGPAYIPVSVFWGFFGTWTLYNFFREYLISVGINRERIKYVFIGMCLFILIVMTIDGIIPLLTGNTQYFRISPLSSLFFVAFTAYAITRHKLLDIRIPIAGTFIGIILLILIFNIFAIGTKTGIISLSISFILIAILGYFLIRTLTREIKTREKAYQELKKLDVAKSEFISIASHQLRTPLTAIKGYISMIMEKLYGQPPEKMGKPLENIYRSNERLIKLVNDLLNVSRIEAGRMEMKIEKLSIEDLITSVVEELKNAAKEKDLYLKWEKTKKPLPKIAIDREKIRQVIMNVVDNAIRYTEKGGVTIKCKAQNEKCKIEVSDTGTGLTKYEISKMFESFSRGAAGTRLYTEGVGLGFYIARRFVEMHDGKIWVESKGKGKGSTFYIELTIK